MTRRVLRLTVLFLNLWVVGAHAQDEFEPAQLLTLTATGFPDRQVGAGIEFCRHDPPDTWLHIGCGLTYGISVDGVIDGRPATATRPRHRGDFDVVLRARNDDLSGFFLGLRSGVTFVDGFDARPTVGADVGWNVRVSSRVLLGATAGAKHVFSLEKGSHLDLTPSFQVNAGFRF